MLIGTLYFSLPIHPFCPLFPITSPIPSSTTRQQTRTLTPLPGSAYGHEVSTDDDEYVQVAEGTHLHLLGVLGISDCRIFIYLFILFNLIFHMFCCRSFALIRSSLIRTVPFIWIPTRTSHTHYATSLTYYFPAANKTFSDALNPGSFLVDFMPACMSFISLFNFHTSIS